MTGTRGSYHAVRSLLLLVAAAVWTVLGAVVTFVATFGDPAGGPDRGTSPASAVVVAVVVLVGLGLWGNAVRHAVLGVRDARGGPRVLAGAVLVLTVGVVLLVVLSAVLGRARA